MTWTCKCDNVTNPDDATKCTNCYAAKSAGLIEEEHAAWEAYRAGNGDRGVAICPIEEAQSMHIRFALNVYRAARAPLEAENAKLRERVRGLEAQLAQAQKPALALTDANRSAIVATWEKRHRGAIEQDRAWALNNLACDVLRAVDCVANGRPLDIDPTATVEEQKPAAPAPGKPEYWQALRWAADRVSSRGDSQVSAELAAPFYALAREINGAIRKQWGTNGPTGEPAAPVGLPADELARRLMESIARSRAVTTVRSYEEIMASFCFGDFLEIATHVLEILRIPPAQTSREPDDFVTVAEGTYATHRIQRGPVAFPPGEVSTETPNLSKWGRETLCLGEEFPMLEAARADIRANVERATAKDKARIAELEAKLRESRILAEKDRGDVAMQRDAALAEVERVRSEKAAWAAEAGKFEAEVERLRGELAQAKADRDSAARLSERDTAEVERLRGELDIEKRHHDDHRLRLCSAAGISDSDWGTVINKVTDLYIRSTAAKDAERIIREQAFRAIVDARVACGCDKNKFRDYCYEKAVAKTRELFTPVDAKDERKVPQVGDKVWTVAVDIDGITPMQGSAPREDVVTDGGFMTEHRQHPRRVCDLGKTWWWSDPSKGAETAAQPQGDELLSALKDLVDECTVLGKGDWEECGHGASYVDTDGVARARALIAKIEGNKREP